VNVPMWMVDWQHECCGPRMDVTDTVDLSVVSYPEQGDPILTRDGPSVTVYDDDAVEIVGDCIGPVYQEGNLASYVVSAGSLHVGLFAYNGTLPVGRVRFRGKLWVDRHEHATLSSTVGQLVSIGWHAAITRETGPRSLEVVGYAEGISIRSTEERTAVQPPRTYSWAYRLMVDVAPAPDGTEE
jgi:hypothetical protein